MFARSLAVAAALACAGLPPLASTAQPAPPAKILRTIVYEVAYSTVTLRREQTSGFTNNPLTNSMGSVAGPGAVDRRFTADDRGTLTIGVIAATPDGGLVVDAAFSGKASAHPPIRVAIFKDGRLSYDPKMPVSPAAIRLLPLLACGFVAEKTIAPGEFWTAPAAVSLPGPAGFDEHAAGKTVYATDLLSPVSLDLTSRIHRQIGADQNDTIDSHLVATLVSDSFAKRPAR